MILIIITEVSPMKSKDSIFKSKAGSTLLAVLACALWGSLFPCIKLSYAAFSIESEDIPSILLFAGVRFLICGAVLIAMASGKEKKFRLPARDALLPVFLIGMTSIVLHYAFTYVGLSMTEGSKTSILKQVGFLFITCFAFLFRKEDKFTFRKLIGGLLGFLSIIIVSLDGLEFHFGIGDLLILCASVCSVSSSIISKNAFDRLDPVHTLAYAQFYGGALLTIAGLILGGRIPHVSLSALLLLGYICASSVVAYALWNVLVKYNDLSKMSIIKFFEPLFGVIFSGLLLGENIFRLTYLLSFIIIAAAVLIINVHREK